MGTQIINTYIHTTHIQKYIHTYAQQQWYIVFATSCVKGQLKILINVLTYCSAVADSIRSLICIFFCMVSDLVWMWNLVLLVQGLWYDYISHHILLMTRSLNTNKQNKWIFLAKVVKNTNTMFLKSAAKYLNDSYPR